MNKHDEKEKLMNELYSKPNRFSNIYNDSLDIITSTEAEINRLFDKNNTEVDKLNKENNYSNDDIEKLKTDIQSDFGISVDTPSNVDMGRASKEVFLKIKDQLKEKIIGQDKACDELSDAFRRPYIIGSNPEKIRTSIIIYGSNGTGRHLLIEEISKLLKKNGLTVADGVLTLDMSRYQTGTQEIIFLQDLFVCLNAKSSIILVENFEEANPIYNRMLSEFVENGNLVLNKRYSIVKNQLQELTSSLNSNIIDHLSGNNKTLVFITDKNLTILMDIFGKTFIDNIADIIQTNKLDDNALNIIIDQLIDSLIKRCNNQLEINVVADLSIKQYLKQIYEPSNGIDSLSPTIRKIYNQLVNITLKKDDLSQLLIKYDDTIKIIVNSEEIDLHIEDDYSDERLDIQKELDDIVGLDDVKNYLLSLENHIKITKIRKQKGLKTSDISKHMIFTGNPGTGKTTIARLVSRLMKVCGILKQGQLVEVTRADLVGKYVGHTAPLTMQVINSAVGGVLFIDEAYSLYRGKDDSFGLEAIDTLVKAMEDHRDDLIVILAGYSKEMEEFLKANSGLKSRFANIIHFEDFTGEEMLQIAQSISKGKGYVINENALKPLKKYFNSVQNRDDPNSGNGRLVRNMIEVAILKQSKRILDNPSQDLNILKLEDFVFDN